VHCDRGKNHAGVEMSVLPVVPPIGLSDCAQHKGQYKKQEDEICRAIKRLRTRGVGGKFGLRVGKPKAPQYGNDPGGTRDFD
jgi:hypothetical protein